MNQDEHFLADYADQLNRRQSDVNEFIADHLNRVEVPIYSSFDLRFSGHKLGIVDPNVYPAGFNNICREALYTSAPLFEQILRKRFGAGLETIGIYVEDHTKNTYYFQNLFTLEKLLAETGFESLLVSTNDQLEGDPAELTTAERDTIHVHQLQADGSGLTAGGRSIDVILSNNDFSAGVPAIFESTDVPVTPPTWMGWWNRRKSIHFRHQRALIEELCELMDWSPERLTPHTRSVSGVDFQTEEGFDRIAETIDEMLESIRDQYGRIGIDAEPYVFVKSDRGTYGMGVYNFRSGEDFLQINRDQRDSMARRKGGDKNTSVVVQEGIPTVDRVTKYVAEPVMYCLEHRPVSGFFRTNEQQSSEDNLNTRGMNFTSEDMCPLFVDEVDKNEGTTMTRNRLDLYQLMGTMGTLACGYELAQGPDFSSDPAELHSSRAGVGA